MQKTRIPPTFLKTFLIPGIFFITCSLCSAQKKEPPKTSAGFPVNYDEELAKNYVLPDVLTTLDGVKVSDVKTWEEKRRPELVHLFEEIQFGKMPPAPDFLSFKLLTYIISYISE